MIALAQEMSLCVENHRGKRREIRLMKFGIQCMLCIGGFLWYMKILDCSGVVYGIPCAFCGA